MRKFTKKSVALTILLVMIISVIPLSANAVKVGDVIGYAQPTDIVATINGYMLESYNVNGYTYICAEDLRYYGFNVVFDYNTKILSVKRNSSYQINPQVANPKFWSIGSKKSNTSILYTNIVTYVNDSYVASCNINGQTIINFSELSRFGSVNYNNNKREISLDLAGVNRNPLADFAAQNEASFNKSNDWSARLRAKGDVLTITYTSKHYYNLSDIKNYQQFVDAVRSSRASFQSYLSSIKSSTTVSSIYVEYCVGNGDVITSLQIYW